MTQTRVLCLVLSLLCPLSLLAQGRPSDPGGGPQLPGATAPQQVVDSTGKAIGDVLKIDGAGINRAAIKYVLPNGDYVVLSTQGYGLGHIGNNSLIAPLSVGHQGARVLFQQPDCQGDAYLNMTMPGVEQQLTRRQAIILHALEPVPQTPIPPGACPMAAGGSFLFATDPLACPVLYQGASNVTFRSYYGQSMTAPYSNCINIGGAGYTVPEPFGPPAATFMVYRRIEDLSLKFTPPFYIP